jgi:hypothetical protein
VVSPQTAGTDIVRKLRELGFAKRSAEGAVGP